MFQRKKCETCCATGSCGTDAQTPLIEKQCASECGVPAFSNTYWKTHQDARAKFIAQNGAQSASLFDYIYGYSAAGNCGGNINYYGQFDAADDSHCSQGQKIKMNAVEAIDIYRGLYSDRQIRGWNTRLTKVIEKKDCPCGTSLANSCSGTLPFPYAQPKHDNRRVARYWLV